MITIYTKDQCQYCHAAKNLLARKGLKYKEIDIGSDWQNFGDMLKRTSRQSVPQILWDDHHIGGYEELYQSLYQAV
jgi:glutaredoxin 3|tara:strand:- start:443 stop:670 length:228 start_codon:yes stop_codon:yes gene_type:complete